MTVYRPPVEEMRFALDACARLDMLPTLAGLEAFDPEIVEPVLEEAGRLAANELAPLNRSGDLEGCTLENGVVRTPAGFADAYRRFAEGGWTGLPFPEAHGGQGLPWTVATAVSEMWHAAMELFFQTFPYLQNVANPFIYAVYNQRFKESLAKLFQGKRQNLYMPR